jgi:hypothetical protein
MGALARTGLSLVDGAQFAAPERMEPATAEQVPDWRGDLYSLALTTCGLLGAEVAPLDAPAPSVTLPPQVHQRLVDPVVLRAILEQSLRRNPAARPGSLDEFRQALELALFGVNSQQAGLLASDLEEPFGPVGGPAPAPPTVFAPPPPAAAAPAFEDAPTQAKKDKERTGPVPIHRRPEIPTPPPDPLLSPPEPAFGAWPEETSVPTVQMPAEPEPRGEGTPAPPVKTQQPVPKRGSGRRVALWVILGTLALGAAAAAVLWVQSHQQRRAPHLAAAPTRAAALPTPAPQPVTQPNAVVQLQNAEAAIALGDLVAARQALDAITPAELETLSPAEKERHANLRETYNARVEQTLTKDLNDSLRTGNLRRSPRP